LIANAGGKKMVNESTRETMLLGLDVGAAITV
jgi:hypothetical protein